MSLELTLGLLVACLVIIVVAGRRGAAPPDLTRGPRMVPWRFLMLSAGAVGMLLLVHLAVLAGMPIGTR